MPRWADPENDWEDDFEPEDEDEFEPDEGDEDATIPCPYCRRQIHEESQRCPYCEQYISEEDAPGRKPWWFILGFIACAFVIYLWIVNK
jgi:hypothetical protein